MSPLPAWIGPWCREHLGSVPVGVLFTSDQTASVWGLRLDDGAEVVLKARDDDGRVAACVQVQARLAARGYPCPRPLTAVVVSGGRAVHAEEFLPGARSWAATAPRPAGGTDGPSVACSGSWTPCGCRPRWRVRAGSGGITPGTVCGRPSTSSTRRTRRSSRSSSPMSPSGCGPGCAGRRVRGSWGTPTSRPRTSAGADRRCGPSTTGTAWPGSRRPRSSARRAEPSPDVPPGEQPSLASIGGTEAFLDAYQEVRGRDLGPDEHQVAWAASLWPVAHNARWDALHGRSWSRSGEALVEQAALRLTRAGA